MSNTRQRKYFRLTKAERVSIERGLDKRHGARQMARDLGRSATSIADEVKRNRTVSKGPGKGERVTEVPEDACTKLLSWPHVCNGCKRRRYHCTKKWRCEYVAARAQVLADDMLCEARRGVNAKEYDFLQAMVHIRRDVTRGLSPAQIAQGRIAEFKVHPSTIYRWISAGYAGMSNVDLRRKVGYKPRKSHVDPKPTSHGPERSWSAFLALPDSERAQVCEMDTVIGKSVDSKCILTLYLKPCKLQVCLLLPDRSSSAVVAALDTLETALGKNVFHQLFGLILTDNGTEFSDTQSLEKSILSGKSARSSVYYCDVRQSQQKGGCEKNHVELRKLLPKNRGIRFDLLENADMATLMSQLNSEPRPSLMGMSPLAMLNAADKRAYDALCSALGIEEISYKELNLTVDALNKARANRGAPPLI